MYTYIYNCIAYAVKINHIDCVSMYDIRNRSVTTISAIFLSR